MPDKPRTDEIVMRYADLPTGNFFRLVAVPERRFFKCRPWVSTTEDLEGLIQFKPEVMVITRRGFNSGQFV